MLEAGTIVGPSPDRLRVARATAERKVVKKYNIFCAPGIPGRRGYDPRIHGVYFCPQLYRYDSDKNLSRCKAMRWKLIANALERG